jgi:hypothetical protein
LFLFSVITAGELSAGPFFLIIIVLINLLFYYLVVTRRVSSLYRLQLAAALLILASGERDQCAVTSLLLLWALDIAPLDRIATHSTANHIRAFLASWRYAMMLNKHSK